MRDRLLVAAIVAVAALLVIAIYAGAFAPRRDNLDQACPRRSPPWATADCPVAP